MSLEQSIGTLAQAIFALSEAIEKQAANTMVTRVTMTDETPKKGKNTRKVGEMVEVQPAPRSEAIEEQAAEVAKHIAINIAVAEAEKASESPAVVETEAWEDEFADLAPAQTVEVMDETEFITGVKGFLAQFTTALINRDKDPKEPKEAHSIVVSKVPAITGGCKLVEVQPEKRREVFEAVKALKF